MNKYTVGNLERISKTKAEKLYNSNVEIYLLDKGMNPDNMFKKPIPIKLDERKISFTKYLNEFEYYNGKAWYWVDKRCL